MIAEAPASLAVYRLPTITPRVRGRAPSKTSISISMNRVVAVLQVMLAARRTARNDDYAYWYAIARGL